MTYCCAGSQAFSEPTAIAVSALLGGTVLVVGRQAGARSALLPLLAAGVRVAIRLGSARYGIGLPIAPSERRKDPPPS